MRKYSREEAVCTADKARAYFKKRGLTYDSVTEGDILTLIVLLNREIKLSNKNRETSTNSMTLSSKVVFVNSSIHTMRRCFLYMNSHYFTQRECISFNENGYIGFAGWADQGNVNPIMRAFLEWCDILAEGARNMERGKEGEKI